MLENDINKKLGRFNVCFVMYEMYARKQTDLKNKRNCWQGDRSSN